MPFVTAIKNSGISRLDGHWTAKCAVTLLGCGHIDTLPDGNSRVSLREFQDVHDVLFFNFPFECMGTAVRQRINMAAPLDFGQT